MFDSWNPRRGIVGNRFGSSPASVPRNLRCGLAGLQFTNARCDAGTFRGGKLELDLELVRSVRPAVEARTRRTPARRAPALDAACGAPVWLKLECEQVTGSFKARGPLALRSRDADLRPWVTASAGNHGLGVAFAWRGRTPHPVVFAPRTVPRVKRRAIESLDAEVRLVESSSFDAAESEALRFAAERGARYVSAFDDPCIMAGNGGTLALEILEQVPDLGSLVFPVGGGGLAAGVGCVVRALRPAVRLVGVQSEATSAMHDSLQRGAAVLQHTGPPTLCEGLEGGVSERSFAYVQRWIDTVQLVPEMAVAGAMRWLWETQGLRVEGSAAVGIAACRSAGALPGPVCVVLTGCNVDDDTWERALRS